MTSNWTDIIRTNNNNLDLVNIIKNYKIVENKKFNLKTKLAPRSEQDKEKAQKDKKDASWNYSAKSLTGGALAAAGAGVGYACVCAGPVGWALIGSYALATAGGIGAVSGAVAYVAGDEYEYSKLLTDAKHKMGFKGAVFSESFSKLYEIKVLKPLIKTAEVLMASDQYYTDDEKLELSNDRMDVINNIEIMLDEKDITFQRELTVGHMQFISALKNLKAIISDLKAFYGDEEIKPQGIPKDLSEMFRDFSKAEQKELIEGIFTLFVMTLAVTKDALEKNTKIESLQVSKKEQCAIM